MATPILCTKFEGGDFYPWPLPMQERYESHRVHSIFFDDGSVLDASIGMRPANEANGSFYREFAEKLGAK